MYYIITISDGTILKECIRHVVFNINTPNNCSTWYNNARNSIKIIGDIDDESTISLYKWALLPATNPDCYKEITIKEYKDNKLTRKVHFSKAFVVSYKEDYSNGSNIGRFNLLIRQFLNKDIEISTEETGNDSVTENTNKVETIDNIKSTKPTIATSSTLPFKKNKPKITDKLEKLNKIKDNNIEEVNYGEHFYKNGRRKVLKPNVQYTTPEGYTYKTDKLGRIVNCKGNLQLGSGKRNKYAQRKIGRKYGKPKDDGGHLIATIFKGSGNIDNLVPMNSNLNRGEWERLERDWAKALSEQPPKEVKVQITPVYKDDSMRPEYFKIKYKIGNDEWQKIRFENAPGGKKDHV